MNKHTPGPWRYEMVSDTDYARIYMREGGFDVMRGYLGIANARLIAAAPELLEALRDMVDCGEVPIGEGERRLENAERVIAKATGEDQ